jgi:hypothetical protein
MGTQPINLPSSYYFGLMLASYASYKSYFILI